MPGGQLNSVFRHICRLAGLASVCDQTDSELLGRFSASRDEAAFTALLHRHGPLVLNICRRVLRNADDADDAFQATFLVLARRAGSVRQSESLASFLYGVAYRVASKARVHAARRRDHERQVADMPKLESGGLALWEEMRPLLDEELSRLPEKYRVPIVLRYLQGKSNEAAAREMGCPAGTLSWRLSQALNLLRQRLARRGVTLSSAVLGTLLAENSTSAAVMGTLHEATLRAAVLFVSGQALAAQGGYLAIISMAEGALRAMWLNQLKMVSVLVTVVILLSGVGFFAFRGWETEAVAVPPPAKQPGREPEGGKAVNGLKLTLSADKTETVMKADGSNAEPVKLTLTFTNVSDKPMKLDTYLLEKYRIKVDVTGPDTTSVQSFDARGPFGAMAVNEVHYPAIPPGKGWTAHELPFPGWRYGDQVISLLKPGEYRVKLTYTNEEVAKNALAPGSWVGTLVSNELVLKVLPVGGKAVNGLKLTLSADKTETVMKADGSNAEPVKLTLTFTNVSDKPITLNAYALFAISLTEEVIVPDAQSMRRLSAPAVEGSVPEPGRLHFPTIEPGKSWTASEVVFPSFMRKMNEDIHYSFLKPGNFRIKFTYQVERTQWIARDPVVPKLAAESWTGTLTSNELELIVKRANN